MDSKRVLVIAGSDSSGGAGLEADQKVIAAHGCYAMTATTALTAQNTLGVEDIYVIPSSFVKKQIDACLNDIGADVIKIGMLASAETVEVVAEALREHTVPFLVIDPVMVATTGAQLLPEDAVKTLLDKILPLATILTPNIPEAQLLLRTKGFDVHKVNSIEELRDLAQAVRKLGPKHVLLKGGHCPLTKDRKLSTKPEENEIVVDILCSPDETLVFESKFIDSKNTHGTGCSLASSIASNLALEVDMNHSVKYASRYIEAGIKKSRKLGKGNGPIYHFHSMQILPFQAGHFIDYMLDRQDVQGPWKEHTGHDFVKQLAAGTLSEKAFRNYLIQDYLFLIQFARANALASYKSSSIDAINSAAMIVTHIRNEMNLHLDFCTEYGLDKDDIERTEETQEAAIKACTAYTRYVLDVGQSEDWIALQVALAPCMLGYGMIARQLYDDPDTKREGNKYFKWIENYVAEEFVTSVEFGCDQLEKNAVDQSPKRIEELVKIFIHATKMETGFWEDALASG